MSAKQFDYLVFIGRMNPFHLGHEEVIAKALKMADNVIILIGSANQPRNIKNPFTFDERKAMISEATGNIDAISILPLRDFKADDNVWAANVQKIVSAEVGLMGWTDMPRRGGIIGHTKDESSYYLKMFPQWEVIEHGMNEAVSATDIRELYFNSNIRYLKDVVSAPVYTFLEKFKSNIDYTILQEEYSFIKSYKKSWAAAPYAPTFVTCDAVVVQSGHILLIKRKAAPGRGLWALPGGFVNQNEKIEAAMIRELREETCIRVPSPVLRGNIKGSKIFDAPDRSLRGRTITQAFFIELPAGDLPTVKGNDDAEKARWVPLSWVKEEEMFEDHYGIITSFLGQI